MKGTVQPTYSIESTYDDILQLIMNTMPKVGGLTRATPSVLEILEARLRLED